MENLECSDLTAKMAKAPRIEACSVKVTPGKEVIYVCYIGINPLLHDSPPLS